MILAGIAMPPVGLCFTDDFFLFLTVAKGCTDINANSCVNTVDEKKSYG